MDTSLQSLHADLRRSPEYAVHDMLDQVRYQLRRRMAETGVKQKALAERMGVKPSVVSHLLRASENTSLLTIARAARALDLDFAVLKLVPADERDAQRDEFGALLRTEDTRRGWWPTSRKPGASLTIRTARVPRLVHGTAAWYGHGYVGSARERDTLPLLSAPAGTARAVAAEAA